MRQNGTILFSIQAPDDQQRAMKFEILQGMLCADETGWIYGWKLGHSYRDCTTPDKLESGCRVSFEVDGKAPFLATVISWRLVK